MTKVRRKWEFLKKVRKFDKVKKKSDFVSLYLQNFLNSKAFKWQKFNLKSFKVRLKLQNFL